MPPVILLLLILAAQVPPVERMAKKTDPAIDAHLRRLDEIRLDAFQAAVRAVGARLPDGASVRLRLIDAVDPGASKITLHDGLAMQTYTLKDGRAAIDIHSEYLVNGMMIPESTLRHEMVHAVMRLDLGDRYRALPKWFREGMAVHLADQTDSRLA